MSRVEKDPQEIERYVDELLRAQPLRRAPPTLQARVLARVRSLPWWRQSFVHWPVAARLGFLILSYGFVRLVLAGAGSVTESMQSGELAGALTPAENWLHAGAAVLSAANSTGASLLHAVPSLWLYGAAAFAVSLYVALFGLGTVAYRTLYINK